MSQMDPLRGWPAGPNDPYTPEGHIQQMSALAHGIRHDRRGMGTAARMALALLIVAVLAALVVSVVDLATG